MKKSKILIVDDEKKSRKLLETLIKDAYDDQFDLFEADSIELAKEVVLEEEPDILLLDINLPPFTAFNLLSSLPSLKFEVVFLTNFAEYALKAFKFSAVDYILKPITSKDLIHAIEKALTRLQKKQQYNRLQGLLKNMESPYSAENHIIIPLIKNKDTSIRVGSIMRCESKRDMTYFYIDKKQEELKSTLGIGECFDLLEDYGFSRIHKQHVINPKFVKMLLKGVPLSVEMTNGEVLPLARRRKKAFMDSLRKK